MSNSHGRLKRLRVLAIAAFLAASAAAAPPATAEVKAEEKAGKIKLKVPVGVSTHVLTYRVSIEDCTGPEEITAVSLKGKIAGLPFSSGTAVKVDKCNWDVTLQINHNNTTGVPLDVELEIVTSVTEKFKNKLRKKNIALKLNGNPDPNNPNPKLPGFEFKSNSPGVYTLFNDTNSSWTVNDLRLRMNVSEVDIETFDLANPGSLSWDLNVSTPFSLNSGSSTDVALGVVLTPSQALYSQAYISFDDDSSGDTIVDIQQHQHLAEPDLPSLSWWALLALIAGLGATGYCRRAIHSRARSAQGRSQG